MSNYPLTKNTIVYYQWKIHYDKQECIWSDLEPCIVTEQGNDQWTTEENGRFCILTYHSSTQNNDTEPSLPEDLGYPGTPTSIYCSLSYSKWRVVKTDSYVGKPFKLSLVSSSGDDYWRQVTPFEYEVTQSDPVFCSSEPAPPSFSNTFLKHDSTATYRVFSAKVKCDSDSGSLTYVSGPTYSGATSSKGNRRWTYEGKSSIDSSGDTVFEVQWVSSVGGLGTAPANFLDADLIAQLVNICFPETSTTTVSSEVLVLNDEPPSAADRLYTGYPVYRVVYHCPEKTFDSVEVVAVSSEKPVTGANIWEYYDTFTLNGEKHCVFYHLSSDLVSDVALEDVTTLPSTSSVPLEECPCSSETDISETLGKIEVISMVISDAIGRSHEANGVYNLVKDGDNWVGESRTLDATLSYDLENWRLDLSYEYEQGVFFRIDHSFLSSDVDINKISLVFVGNVLFSDEDGNDYCSVSLEGNVFDEFSESSSSSSESSSNSSVTVSDQSSSSSSSSSSSNQS